jgi:hypothetical protein
MDEPRVTPKRKWSPITPMSVRLDFEKDPIAHTLIHMAGKDAPNLVRKVLREYAISNGLPAADPAVQQEFALAGTRRLLEGVSPVATTPTTMVQTTQASTAPAPTPAKAQEHSPSSPQDQQVATPKPRRALDFGATPTAAENPMANQDQAQPADPMARQHQQWFKDDDKY